MSQELISRSFDLQKLQDEGYEIEIRSGYLIIHSVPYVNSRSEIANGILITDLTLNDNRTQRPGNHQVWFTGEPPCNRDGTAMAGIGIRSNPQTLIDDITVQYRFSCKPQSGYSDYYEKMSRYAEILSNPARAIDPKVTVRTYNPIESSEEDSIFKYIDSASSRAGIAGIADKLAMDKIAIIGPGGTGAYVLDLVAKTHAKEVHLFDGDDFLQHNAFRSPGAPSLEVLQSKPSKVAYYADLYGQMRCGIIPHEEYLDEDNINQLIGFAFVFLCVDKSTVRKFVSDYLIEQQIPFIDTGMDLSYLEDLQCLYGTCRVTLCTPEMAEHYPKHVSLGTNQEDDVYTSNIQVADLNALNAALAVIKWKKYCGFYQDIIKEHQSAYAINGHTLTRDELEESQRS